ncbi:MAG: hypothetical protein H6968_11780 [Chromatiaceae bacterium]|nr:hypothetical protein [Chromatiaceae bacterium]
MKSAVGRVLFFDELAEGILQYAAGRKTHMVALSVGKEMDTEDRISLASAICRILAKSSRHVEFHRAKSIKELVISRHAVIDAQGGCTSEIVDIINRGENIKAVVVITDYSINDCVDLHEIIFDCKSERELVETAVQKLFQQANIEYDPLAPIRFTLGGFEKLETDFDLFEDSATINYSADSILERFCYTVCKTWRYDDEPVDGDRVYRWLKQFQEEGFGEEARDVLTYLKRQGFVTRKALIENAKQIFEEFRETLDLAPMVVNIQPMGKSEGLLAYFLRPITKFIGMNEALIASEERTTPTELVCFDDVIVSGRSMQDYLFNPKVSDEASLLEDALREGRVRLTIIVSYADKRGISAIEQDIRGHHKVKVKAANVLDERARVFHSESMVFKEGARKTEFKSFCKKVGKNINPRNPLGWKNAQWCIVMDYSVPNGTLPILWASSRHYNWIPLFPRSRVVTSS